MKSLHEVLQCHHSRAVIDAWQWDGSRPPLESTVGHVKLVRSDRRDRSDRVEHVPIPPAAPTARLDPFGCRRAPAAEELPLASAAE